MIGRTDATGDGPVMNEKNAIVASRWSANQPDTAKGFFGFPALRRHLIELSFGPEAAERQWQNRWWAEDLVAEQFLDGGEGIRTVLSLCCGFGVVEQHFVESFPVVEHCLGVDIADGALRAARLSAESRGLDRVIEYRGADVNTFPWPENAYDLVVASGALHHLAGLRGVLEGVGRALRPGGVLYANEHVGARHLAHSPRQVELINAVALIVPPELRVRSPFPFSRRTGFTRLLALAGGSLRLCPQKERGAWPVWKKGLARVVDGMQALAPAGGTPVGQVYIPDPTGLQRRDPSESVSAPDILPLVGEFFEDVTILPYGGGVLRYALDEGFYDGFDPDNSRHEEVLSLVCTIERTLMECGELGPEHAIIIARRPRYRSTPVR